MRSNMLAIRARLTASRSAYSEGALQVLYGPANRRRRATGMGGEELEEEAGLADVPVTPVQILRPARLEDGTRYHWALFAAEVSEQVEVRLVDPEHDRFVWVTPDRAAEMVRPKPWPTALLRPSRRGEHPTAEQGIRAAHGAHMGIRERSTSRAQAGVAVRQSVRGERPAHSGR